MDTPFWIDMWEKAQTGFHLTNVHPMLERHRSALGAGAGDKVLVPLCGKSLDLIYLMSQGYSVTGIELSPIAIRQFLTEHDLKANQTVCVSSKGTSTNSVKKQ
jgi:thiopurine S-methyltransferase